MAQGVVEPKQQFFLRYSRPPPPLPFYPLFWYMGRTYSRVRRAARVGSDLIPRGGGLSVTSSGRIARHTHSHSFTGTHMRPHIYVVFGFGAASPLTSTWKWRSSLPTLLVLLLFISALYVRSTLSSCIYKHIHRIDQNQLSAFMHMPSLTL